MLVVGKGGRSKLLLLTSCFPKWTNCLGPFKSGSRMTTVLLVATASRLSSDQATASGKHGRLITDASARGTAIRPATCGYMRADERLLCAGDEHVGAPALKGEEAALGGCYGRFNARLGSAGSSCGRQQTMVGKLDQQWLDRQPTLKHALVSTSTALADCVSEVQRLTDIERKLQQDLLQARSSATSTTSDLAGIFSIMMHLL